ncbi:MAG: leucine-rich repeat protein, partial [Pseudohongiellaceae bacterium]
MLNLKRCLEKDHNRPSALCIGQFRLLLGCVLIALADSHVRAAGIADLTYVNHGTYIEITDCLLTAAGELIIPDTLEGLPVTTIGDSAFRECAGLTSVTLPGSLTTIGAYAFRECNGLTSIYIPDSVSSMDLQAFNRCENLQQVRLSESLSKIDRNAFGYCYRLESITIPSGISTLGANAFLNCSSLRSVFFRGGSLPSIGGGAFSGIASGAIAYHITGATGLDDPDLAPLTLVDAGPYSPFKEWLAGHGLDLDLDPEADLSGDGVSLFEAYALNLNPHATNSRVIEFGITNSIFEISYYSVSPWVRYEPWASTNLIDWTAHGISVTGPDHEGISTAGISLQEKVGYIRLQTEYPVFHVAPSGTGMAFTRSSPGAVADALAAAPPGGTIRLLPGTYPKIEVGVSGMPEKPIKLISDSADPAQYAIIDGGNTTGANGNQGMVISNASWLVIENLKFQNCWENIIELDNSSYITVRGCD